MEITHPGLTEIKRWSGRMEELTGHPGMEEPAAVEAQSPGGVTAHG